MAEDEAIVIDTPDGIAFARLVAIRGRVNLEIKGIKFRGRPILRVVREVLGDDTIRTKAVALDRLTEAIDTALADRRGMTLADWRRSQFYEKDKPDAPD